ncbi:MAG: energy transducer TonB [Gemmatimonadales bacterium]
MHQKPLFLVAMLTLTSGPLGAQGRTRVIAKSEIIGSGASNVAQVIEMRRPSWWRALSSARASRLRLMRRLPAAGQPVPAKRDWRCTSRVFVGEDPIGEIPDDLSLTDVTSIHYYPAGSDRPDGARQCDTPAIQIILAKDARPLAGQILNKAQLAAAGGVPPERLSCPPLDYPTALRQSGIEGKVVVQVVIDPAGRTRPGSVKIVSATHDGFRQPVIDLMNACRWKPGTVSGAPVPVLIEIPFQFSLIHL